MFPKHMYKRGTGKAVGVDGFFVAEAVVVGSAEQLADLGSDWCNTPVEAANLVDRKEQEEGSPKPSKKAK